MYLVKLIHAASRYLAVPPIQSQLTLPANIDVSHQLALIFEMNLIFETNLIM